MEQKFDRQPKLTRRGFLKTMAAGTAAAASALSLPGIALTKPRAGKSRTNKEISKMVPRLRRWT